MESRARRSRSPIGLESLESRRLLSGVPDSQFVQAVDPLRSLVVQPTGFVSNESWAEVAAGASVVRSTPGSVWLALPAGSEPGVIGRRLVEAGLARSAAPVHALSIAAIPNDTRFAEQWGLNNPTNDQDIDAPEAWDVTQGSMSVAVGVIDTGIDYRHDDLYLNIWINPNEVPADARAAVTDVDGDGVLTFRDLNNPVNIGVGKIQDVDGNGRIDAADLLQPRLPSGAGGWEDGLDDGNGYVDDLIGWDFFNNDNDPFDDNNHGTHVAGTIGALGDNATGVAGVAWNVRLAAIKMMSAGGSGNDADAAEAIRYSASLGLRITNSSWGDTALGTVVRDAIAEAASVGQVFVAAAGNNAQNIDATGQTFYPAGYDLPNIVSVAASARSGAMASFSNWGATRVDLAAPGSGILSTVASAATPSRAYASFSGTSMAAPHVAGTLALLLARAPSLTVAEAKAALLASVDVSSAFQGKVVSNGRLNAAAALARVTPAPTDIRVLGFAGAGEGMVAIRYEIGTSPASSFDVTVKRSTDDLVDGSDETLGTFRITAASALSSGAHLLTLPLGAGAGALALPGAGATAMAGDGYLLAIADLRDEVVEVDATPLEDNVAVFVGAYHLAPGPVVVHGSADSETLTLTTSASEAGVSWGGGSASFPLSGSTSLHVLAHGGDDLIEGSGASLPISAWAGPGNDTIRGGLSADSLDGGPGADTWTVRGSTSNDTITIDVVAGGLLKSTWASVEDRFNSDTTDRIELFGDAGRDFLTISAAVRLPALVDGGAGNDEIHGGAAADVLFGRDGYDWIDGGGGDDVADGGLGFDTVVILGTLTAELVTPNWIGGSTPLEVSRQAIATGAMLERDRIGGFELLEISTAGGNDRLDFSTLSLAQRSAMGLVTLSLDGGGHDDVVIGSPGVDIVSGGTGTDIVDGGLGIDTIRFRGLSNSDYLEAYRVDATTVKAQWSYRATPTLLLEVDTITIEPTDQFSIVAGAGDDLINVSSTIGIAGTVDGGAGVDQAITPPSWSRVNVEL